MLLVEIHKSKAANKITPELNALLLDEVNQMVRRYQAMNAETFPDPAGSVAKAMVALNRGLLDLVQPKLLVNTEQATKLVRKIIINCLLSDALY